MATKKYTYEGNRSGGDTTSTLTYGDKDYAIGDQIPLTAAERDRLAERFILTDSEGEDVAEGTPAPEDPADVNATATEPDATGSTSDSGRTINDKASSSASSRKS